MSSMGFSRRLHIQGQRIRVFRPSVPALGWRLLTVAVAATIVAVGLLFTSLGGFGSATADSSSCNGSDYGQAGAQEEDDYTFNSRGTAASVWTMSGATACQRVSSISLTSVGGGLLEVGWITGEVDSSYCNIQAVSRATMFIVWRNEGGLYHCFVTSNRPSGGTFHNFKLSDENANSWWGAWLDGNSLTPNGIDLNFTQGFNLVSMERGMPADSGSAKWISIQEFHDGNQWTYWDNATRADLVPDDPDWVTRIINSHEADTVLD